MAYYVLNLCKRDKSNVGSFTSIQTTNFNASRECSIFLEAVISPSKNENYLFGKNCSNEGGLQDLQTLILVGVWSIEENR